MRLSKKSIKLFKFKISKPHHEFLYFTNTSDKKVSYEMCNLGMYSIPFSVYNKIDCITIINIGNS